MFPLRHPSTLRPALGLVLALVLASCAGPSSADPVSPRGPDPYEVTISTEVQGPGGQRGDVVIRTTVVGERRYVVFDSPLGVVAEHVVAPADHWFRLAALTAEPLGVPDDWVHLPLDELELADIDLPASLAEVRAPLPDPATVAVGDLVHGVREVLEVQRLDDGAARLGLDDGRTVLVRRRSLPAETTVEPPASAIDVRELDDLVG